MDTNRIIINALKNSQRGYHCVTSIYEAGVDHIVVNIVKNNRDTFYGKSFSAFTSQKYGTGGSRGSLLNYTNRIKEQHALNILYSILYDDPQAVRLLQKNKLSKMRINIGKLVKDRSKFVSEKEEIQRLTDKGNLKAFSNTKETNVGIEVEKSEDFLIKKTTEYSFIRNGNEGLIADITVEDGKVTSFLIYEALTTQEFQQISSSIT